MPYSCCGERDRYDKVRCHGRVPLTASCQWHKPGRWLLAQKSEITSPPRLVLSARGDGTGFFTPETSRAKAVASAAFKRSNKELAEMVAQGGFWAVVPTVLQGQILPTLGATPIVRGGQVIGAIGCGGGTGLQDQECSDAGAAAVK